MKKLSRINLHNLSQAELAKREEKLLKGGSQIECACACVGGVICGCKYAGGQSGSNDSYYGGSSTEANDLANFDKFITNKNDDAQKYS